ncbi:tricarboxylate transporter [Salibacterium salarium]|uniref:Tricarboxylate transporter n=1 Tax=Salibacterium salarium TaxID=284579 RepID=A0A428N6Y2_9BACI|nr:tricarboxylate transporter [Salibacterium salarium]
MQGFGTALTFKNIIAALVGAIIGIIVGAIPGLGSVTGVALLLPLTFNMEPVTGIIMLAGIYYGGMYGGSYSAILINIPGDSPAVTTALDGYPMSQKGKAGKALFTANMSSFIGGTIGIIILTFMGPLLAQIGLAFGPPEIATLILLALCSVGWMLGENPRKGVIGTMIGILLATIGVDMTTGSSRFTFGSPNLLSGLSFIPLVIGMFGFSQILEMVTQKLKADAGELKVTIKESLLDKNEIKRTLPVSLRSGFLGNFIGILPGAGATTGSLLSYIFQKRVSKNKDEMGKGSMEGVSASEAGNNGAAVGAFAPLLSLGIPGSGTAAVLLGGLMMWGLQPGPLLFEQQPDFVWGLVSSLYIGNILTVVAALLIIPLLMHIIRIPTSIMVPVITVVCIIGAYSYQNSMFDVWAMIITGIIAFFLKSRDYPIAPLLLAFVLTPRLEEAVFQSFASSGGSASIFFSSPISLLFLLMIVVFIISPVVFNLIKKNNEKKDDSMVS